MCNVSFSEIPRLDITVSIRPDSSPVGRRKRQAAEESIPGWYENNEGEILSQVDYTVSVKDKQVDPLFVAEPSEQRLNSFLADVDTSTCGCSPAKCYSIYVQVGEMTWEIRVAYSFGHAKVFRHFQGPNTQ